MFFTSNQIQELLNIIDKNILVFIAQNIGVDILTKKDKQLLLKAGVDIKSLTQTDDLALSFKFGLLSMAIGDARAKDLTFDKFKQFVLSKKFLPLSETEEMALKFVKQRSYADIKNLSNNIGKSVSNTLLSQSIKDELGKTITERKTVTELAADLRKKTSDYTQNFERISDYIMHEAYDYGRAMFIQKELGVDAKVYKSVYSGACEICQRLYLTNGLGSKPKIFTLSELLANGNNIGRSSKEYKAVIGTTHPYCRCTLHDVPLDYDWDNKKMQFVPVRNTYGVKRKSKAKVTIS